MYLVIKTSSTWENKQYKVAQNHLALTEINTEHNSSNPYFPVSSAYTIDKESRENKLVVS